MNDEIRIYEALRRRYRDAYLNARVTMSAGTSIKYAGVVLGVALGLMSLFAREGALIAAGIFGAVLVALWIYSIGVNIASQGQQLLALLDTAVNSFGGLSDAQRAEILSLEMAGEAQSVENLDHGRGVARDPVSEMPDDEVWVCKACIRKNPLSQTSCRLCGAPRP